MIRRPPRSTLFPTRRSSDLAQSFRVVDVVQERREPQLLILLCCLTYPLERARRVFPARCPGRVLLEQVPFGQTFSLHPLDRKSTRLNSSHGYISYAVFCLKKKKSDTLSPTTT